jgi:hypothetical protein
MACIILFAMHSLIWPSTTIDKGRWLVVRTSADVGGAPCHRYGVTDQILIWHLPLSAGPSTPHRVASCPKSDSNSDEEASSTTKPGQLVGCVFLLLSLQRLLLHQQLHHPVNPSRSLYKKKLFVNLLWEKNAVISQANMVPKGSSSPHVQSHTNHAEKIHR